MCSIKIKDRVCIRLYGLLLMYFRLYFSAEIKKVAKPLFLVDLFLIVHLDLINLIENIKYISIE